ncbi:hypothetical protein BCS89_23580 [Vibrio splendidus]|nr:hypothetical protein BCS97_24240 [Vibrio splendidus]PMP33625.1 hypothetical protein BCS89_23580 [Vibrio splendidus]PMP39754.1 hypothetical protein BCS88_23695 [Vibrio splendidus]PMP45905.1 hypothetical protein BCS87_23550 [Vibrio splendidus]PMP51492.1 hypothetical protein BCS83_19245 [Vibrio splendidus]
MNSIRTLSNRILILLWGVLFLNPISFAVLWFSNVFNSSSEFFFFDAPFDIELPLGIGQALSGYLISNITVIVAALITWQLIKLFNLYRIGKVFTSSNIMCYQKIANMMILYVVIGYLEEFLLGFALTYGGSEISFGVSAADSDIALLTTGIIVRVIAKVMAEAKILQDDQSLTI